MNPQRRRMRGLSLIEIMVALLIGSLLILGLVQVFAASRTAYQMSEGMARVQENARFAMDFLQRDLRMAGHFGCINDQAHLQVPAALQTHFGGTLDNNHPLNFAISVMGFEAPGTAPGDEVQLKSAGNLPTGFPGGLSPSPVPDSDILMLRYLGTRGAPVTGIAPGGGGAGETLTLAANRWRALTVDGVATPSYFGVADCSHVDVFLGSSPGGEGEVPVSVAPLSATTDLVGRYTPQPSGQTMLYRAESIVYYVGRRDNEPTVTPSLYRARYLAGSYQAEELVEGIESMQLLFGLDETADLSTELPKGYVSEYQTAAGVNGEPSGWRRVGVIQVGMLASSPNRAAAGQAEAGRNVLGVKFTEPDTDDGVYRAGYETTIALRNRLYGN